MFSGVDMVKWVVTGVSHSHSFSVLPPHMPRNTFPDDVVEKIRRIAAEKVNVAEIKLIIHSMVSHSIFNGSLSLPWSRRHGYPYFCGDRVVF